MPNEAKQTDIDHGWAWLVLISVSLGAVIQSTLLYSCGVIYVALLEKFEDGYTKTSLVGSINTGLMCLAAPLSGMMINKSSSRVTIITGAVLSTFGYIISAFALSLDVFIFSLGIIVGFAYACIASGMMVALGYYFDRWRGPILTIPYILVSVGMFTAAPLGLLMIEYYSLRGTFIIMAGVNIHICIIGMICKPSSLEKKVKFDRQQSPRRPSVPSLHKNIRGKISRIFNIFLLTNLSFICFLIGTGSWNFSLSIGIMHLPNYVTVHGGDSDQIRWVTMAFSIGHIVGRIAGCFVVKFMQKPFTIHISSLLAAGIIAVMYPAYSQYKVGVYVFAILLGLSCGVPSAMLTSIATEFVNVSMLPDAYSLAYLFSGIGITAGPIVAGCMYDSTGDYVYSFLMAGAGLLVGGLLSLVSFCTKKDGVLE